MPNAMNEGEEYMHASISDYARKKGKKGEQEHGLHIENKSRVNHSWGHVAMPFVSFHRETKASPLQL